MKKVLFVDYENILDGVVLEDSFKFIKVFSVKSLDRWENNAHPDMIFFHLRDYSERNISELKSLRSFYTGIPIVVGSRTVELELVIELTKCGIDYFLSYPFRLFDIKRQISENLIKNISCKTQEEISIIGNTQLIRNLQEQAIKYAQTDFPIMLSGETGTGKDLFSRFIHLNSKFAKGPYYAFNIGSLSSSLLNAELFGAEKGAYTGCLKTRKGIFEMANYGTLFLDELEDMPSETQSVMLRVVENKKIRRVGNPNLVEIYPRIVCATNESIKEKVEKGQFRSDLYYRLNILSLEIPPLRDRLDDIPLLCGYFLSGRNKNISTAALKKLQAYRWPGNIRELQNVLKRSLVLSSRRIEEKDIIF